MAKLLRKKTRKKPFSAWLGSWVVRHRDAILVSLTVLGAGIGEGLKRFFAH